MAHIAKLIDKPKHTITLRLEREGLNDLIPLSQIEDEKQALKDAIEKDEIVYWKCSNDTSTDPSTQRNIIEEVATILLIVDWLNFNSRNKYYGDVANTAAGNFRLVRNCFNTD